MLRFTHFLENTVVFAVSMFWLCDPQLLYHVGGGGGYNLKLISMGPVRYSFRAKITSETNSATREISFLIPHLHMQLLIFEFDVLYEP